MGDTRKITTKEVHPFFERKEFEEKLMKRAAKLLNLDVNEDNEHIAKAVIYHVDKLSNIIIDSYIKSKEKEKCKM